MTNHEPGRDDQHPGSRVVPLTPVVHGRAIPTLPRTLVIALVVGAIAFVAGLQVNLGRTPEVAVVSPSPTTTASPAPTGVPSPAGQTPPVISPTSLPLIDTFKPGPIITATPGGKSCRTDATAGPDVPSAGLGPVPIRTWLAWCPLKAGVQADFGNLLFQEFANAVSASFGWSATTNEAGLSTAEFPFLDDGIPVTLVVAIRPVGDNLVIALTLVATPT